MACSPLPEPLPPVPALPACCRAAHLAALEVAVVSWPWPHVAPVRLAPLPPEVPIPLALPVAEAAKLAPLAWALQGLNPQGLALLSVGLEVGGPVHFWAVAANLTKCLASDKQAVQHLALYPEVLLPPSQCPVMCQVEQMAAMGLILVNQRAHCCALHQGAMAAAWVSPVLPLQGKASSSPATSWTVFSGGLMCRTQQQRTRTTLRRAARGKPAP